jgi:HEAT repeat protein
MQAMAAAGAQPPELERRYKILCERVKRGTEDGDDFRGSIAASVPEYTQALASVGTTPDGIMRVISGEYEKALRDPSDDVRREAVKGLGKIALALAVSGRARSP